MKLGGMSPFPRSLGGGRPRVQVILDSLNNDRGTALDATNRLTTVYVANMAIARAISAAWGTNVRLGNLWTADRASIDIVARWEKILNLSPSPTDSDKTRRDRVGALLIGFGQASVATRLTTLLAAALGSAFVAIEHISYANARVVVPDGSYPWGVVGTVPWMSTVAHILIKTTLPTGWSESQFYDAVGQVAIVLDPILPVWATFDWYRAGPVSVNVTGGPSAGGFYMNDSHNLDNEVFDA